jgi:hypothetical protein
MTLGSVAGAETVSCYKRARLIVSVSMSREGISYGDGEVSSYWSCWSLQHFVQHAASEWAGQDPK